MNRCGLSYLYQCGVEPDTEETRQLVTDVLGWTFDERVDEGVWLVGLPNQLTEGHAYEVTLHVARGDNEWTVKLGIEWP